MSQTKLATKSGGEITNKIPRGFFYNPEYNFKLQEPIRNLGGMDTETRKWFLSNLSQNDLVTTMSAVLILIGYDAYNESSDRLNVCPSSSE